MNEQVEEKDEEIKEKEEKITTLKEKQDLPINIDIDTKSEKSNTLTHLLTSCFHCVFQIVSFISLFYSLSLHLSDVFCHVTF